jgi:N-acetylneuraminate lyase
MLEFLKQGAARIPNLTGLKFTSTNLMALQQCLELEDGRFNILFGVDEMLLAGLALGAHGAVGSTYNYAASLYHKLMTAFKQGDLVTAQALQMKSVKLVEVLCQYGVLPAGKAIMGMLGADCGPARPPVRRLSEQQHTALRQQIESLGVLAKPLVEAATV